VASLAGCSGSVTSEGSPDATADATADVATDAPVDAPVADAGADATPDGQACAPGSITFALNAAAGDPHRYCLGAPSSCGTQWLDVIGADGGSIALQAVCEAACDVCQPVACPLLCAIPGPIPDGGAIQTWDGTTYESGTCGASHLGCVSKTCIAPGNYVARMCGYVDQGQDAGGPPYCNPGTTPSCTDVAFAWPPAGGTATVRGILGGVDGGPAPDGG
jgi:hypothetical protein